MTIWPNPSPHMTVLWRFEQTPYPLSRLLSRYNYCQNDQNLPCLFIPIFRTATRKHTMVGQTHVWGAKYKI